jgi:oligoribonuclease (3'-5' exoribonuclease)
MKYIALDLETTCINPKQPENIIMASLVYEDTNLKQLPKVEDLPHLTCFVKQEEYCGEAQALAMNAWILDILARDDESKYPILTLDQFTSRAIAFINHHFNRKAVVAGKNVVGFDMQFLPDVLQAKFASRAIDTGSVFIDWSRAYPPSSEELKTMLDIPGEVSHDSYKDNIDTILALRTTYGKPNNRRW